VSPAFRDCAWEQRSVAFDKGDLLFLYTDGVSDALAGTHDYVEDSIVQLVLENANPDVPLLDSVLARAREQFGGRPQPDDLTLLSVTTRTAG
jgi:serine phosphatase RsbU (regulator of sigma subunit)